MGVPPTLLIRCRETGVQEHQQARWVQRLEEVDLGDQLTHRLRETLLAEPVPAAGTSLECFETVASHL